ncbi:MAG: DUF4976 domain-containing protein, partial [Gemmatimonadetes bacterium]|nr:DUF4976 domain-containing protein [Gemmatimonadota bacterium]
ILYEHTEEGELYDLTTDPDQYTNLWNEPAMQSVRADLLQQFLQRRMTQECTQAPRVSFA